jgi:DNA-binding NarL/FixJ family response regulator
MRPESRSAFAGERVLPRLSLTILCEHEITRRRLSSILRAEGLAVSAPPRSVEALVADWAGRPLDAVVVAWEQLGGEEVARIRMLRRELPGKLIVVVTGEASRRALRDALDEGADGLVMEREAEGLLALAVRAVCAGSLVLPADLREHVSRPALSAREKQVLGMVVMGFTNGEIAAKLHVAESTVKSHLSSAFAKLDVRSRNEATALILDPERGLGTGVLAISGAESGGESR